MEVWIQMIGSFGFPIACCAGLAIYVQKKLDKDHDEVVSVIKQNTEALAEVSTYLKVLVKEEDRR